MNEGYEKLEMFEREIMARAEAERRRIEQESAEMKRSALEQEENRLLAELYQRIQSQIAQIRTENVKEVSRETSALKRALYQQREQYVTELLSRARAELALFIKGEKYPAYMQAQAARLGEEYAAQGGQVRLLVRERDLALADSLKAAYGGSCTVEADGRIALGGVILSDPARGVEADRTLDAALAAQRAWLSEQPALQFEQAKND